MKPPPSTVEYTLTVTNDKDGSDPHSNTDPANIFDHAIIQIRSNEYQVPEVFDAENPTAGFVVATFDLLGDVHRDQRISVSYYPDLPTTWYLNIDDTPWEDAHTDYGLDFENDVLVPFEQSTATSNNGTQFGDSCLWWLY